MKDKIKRLDPHQTRALLQNAAERELMLKVNEIVERINELEDKMRSMSGEKLWDLSGFNQ